MIAALAAAGLFPAAALAQSDIPSPAAEDGFVANRTDMTVVTAMYPRLTSVNPSGMVCLPLQRVAVVGAGAVKSDGGYVNYSESDNSVLLGADTEAYQRIGDRMVLHGALSFDWFRGKNMGGSAFEDPDFAPFNLVEYTDDNRGTGKKEFYHLVGGLAGDLGRGWSLGAELDYRTGDFTKTRDLRHSNTILDLRLNAGFTWKAARCFSLGLNYSYRNYVETMVFKTYGTSDQSYYTLIDWGAFFGQYEVQSETGGGVTEKGSRQPLMNNIHGGALQLDFFAGRSSILNEFAFGVRSGYFGIDNNSNVIYTDHTGFDASYALKVLVDGERNHHNVSLDACFSLLGNNERSYKISTINTYKVVEYFGSNRVGDKLGVSGSLRYEGLLGLDGFTPVWVVSAGLDGRLRNVHASVYPYYRDQTLLMCSADASLKRNIEKGRNLFAPSMNLAFSMGFGEMNSDDTETTPSELQKPPRVQEKFLQWEYDYLTAPGMSAGLSFRYSRYMKKNFTPFVEISYTYSRAFGAVSFPAGPSRHVECLKLGFNF